MSKPYPFLQSKEELPPTLPIFPLPGAVLLPRGHLPLNIFEPRYLNMVNDAMRSDRLIGMIQPIDESHTELSKVGCAGRIIRYEETRDGRIEILLAGLCRFAIKEELSSVRDYRLVQAEWAEYAADLESSSNVNADQALLFKGALRQYLQSEELELDHALLDKLHIEDLLNSMISYLPLDQHSKQILLETTTLEDRVVSFIAILQNNNGEALQH